MNNVCLYNGILYRNKSKQTTTILNDMVNLTISKYVVAILRGDGQCRAQGSFWGAR